MLINKIIQKLLVDSLSHELLPPPAPKRENKLLVLLSISTICSDNSRTKCTKRKYLLRRFGCASLSNSPLFLPSQKGMSEKREKKSSANLWL